MEEKIQDWKARLTQVRDEMAAEQQRMAARMAADWGCLLSAEYSLDDAIGDLQQIIGKGQPND